MSQKLYIVRKGQDADLGALTATSLAISGVSVDTAVLLASGQAVDLNGEAGGLIFDADANTKMYASADDVVTLDIGGAADFSWLANIFRALAGSVIETNTINETTAASGVTIDSLLVKDATLQAWKYNVITKAANFNVATAESGCVYEIGAADVVATLPATAPGLHYRFVVTAAGLSTITGFSVSPNAADKIMGNGFTSADDKDAINTAATDAEGNFIEVTADSAGLGWYITGVGGVWARET